MAVIRLRTTAPGQRDFNIMLIGRQAPAAVDELFQQRRRIVFAAVDNGASGRVPSSRRNRRAGGIEDGIGAVRVTDPKTEQRAIETLSSHAALPCFRLPRISSTSSAPISLWITTSIGHLSSSIGCDRTETRAPPLLSARHQEPGSRPARSWPVECLRPNDSRSAVLRRSYVALGTRQYLNWASLGAGAPCDRALRPAAHPRCATSSRTASVRRSLLPEVRGHQRLIRMQALSRPRQLRVDLSSHEANRRCRLGNGSA